MSFFTPRHRFTHRARFYGVPCYYRADGPDGCELAGTNIIFDWMIEHVCPWIHWVREQICALVLGADYEPSEWQIELRGRINNDQH